MIRLALDTLFACFLIGVALGAASEAFHAVTPW